MLEGDMNDWGYNAAEGQPPDLRGAYDTGKREKRKFDGVLPCFGLLLSAGECQFCCFGHPLDAFGTTYLRFSSISFMRPG